MAKAKNKATEADQIQDTHNPEENVQETETSEAPEPQPVDMDDISKNQTTPLEDSIETLKKEATQQKENALRAMAELENFKKRKQLEVDTQKKFAAENFVRDLLPVLDGFDLACEHAKTDQNKDYDTLLQGFVMIQKQFHQVLEKLNVLPIEALDKPFDPNLHQAVAQEEIEGTDPDVVIKEMQKGYMLHDRVLRPSMVSVSK